MELDAGVRIVRRWTRRAGARSADAVECTTRLQQQRERKVATSLGWWPTPSHGRRWWCWCRRDAPRSKLARLTVRCDAAGTQTKGTPDHMAGADGLRELKTMELTAGCWRFGCACEPAADSIERTRCIELLTHRLIATRHLRARWQTRMHTRMHLGRHFRFTQRYDPGDNPRVHPTLYAVRPFGRRHSNVCA